MEFQLLVLHTREGERKERREKIKRVPSSAMFVVLTSPMYLNMSCMARGMTPGSGPLPIMVWVFPLDVCP